MLLTAGERTRQVQTSALNGVPDVPPDTEPLPRPDRLPDTEPLPRPDPEPAPRPEPLPRPDPEPTPFPGPQPPAGPMASGDSRGRAAAKKKAGLHHGSGRKGCERGSARGRLQTGEPALASRRGGPPHVGSHPGTVKCLMRLS